MPTKARFHALALCALLLPVAGFAGPVTILPQYGEVTTISWLDHVNAGGHGLSGGTNGVPLAFTSEVSVTGPNTDQTSFSLLAAGQASQQSQANAQGVSFAGAVSASLVGSNLLDPDPYFYYNLNTVPSLARSQMQISLFVSEATQFTFDASLNVIRDENPRSNVHEIFLTRANNFTSIAALNATGTTHVTGWLQPGYYNVGARLWVDTSLFDGPSTSAAEGSFSLQFLSNPAPAVPDTIGTWAGLLVGLGLCVHLRRRQAGQR